jgi:hypothetical protein
VAVAAECLEAMTAFAASGQRTLNDNDDDDDDDDDVDIGLDLSELPEPSLGTAKDNIVYYIAGFCSSKGKACDEMRHLPQAFVRCAK